MKIFFPAAAAIALFALALPGLAQPAAKPPVASDPPAAGEDAPQGEYFGPGLDDLMTMLIQPRHIKLFYAGNARNWELAAAENRELRAALDRVTVTVPSSRGYDMPVQMASFVFPKLDGVDAAIAAADPKRFAAAYKDLTAACNGCHTYMEHPYYRIRIPDPAKPNPYPNQDYLPR